MSGTLTTKDSATVRLRSNFERGSTRWAVRRAQWLAMGIAPADLDKPKIAVVNTSSQLSVCFQHLDEVSKVVQQAIRAAGGLPFEIHTAAPSDFVTSAGLKGRYLLPTRDLIVNDIEVQVEGAQLDGMVLLSSCDKTTPGHLMAAARLNIPSIVVPCGYQLGGMCNHEHVDIEEVYKAVGSVVSGAIGIDDLQAMTCTAVVGPGVCAGLATANSMHVMAEALGMALPGSAPIRAGSERLFEMAAKAAMQIVDLIRRDVRPRQIMTPAAFENAISVAVAIGCSVNVVRHLAGTATEAECDIDVLAKLDEVSNRIPQITQVRPNGPDRIEDLDAAGGCAGVLLRLRSVLHTDVLTVTGNTLAVNLEQVPEPNGNVIRPLEAPFRSEPGLVVLHGNLAPDGAVVKLSAVPESVRVFRGPARIFEDEDEAILALGDGRVCKGDVVVMRMMGPLGGPGTVFACSFMAALVGAGLGDHVAVVTDGELSGLNRGITVGQVMPEAAAGGPLAVVAEGDLIEIDLSRRSIVVELPDAVLLQRLNAWQLPERELKPGWLTLYAQLVQPMRHGAVLGLRRRTGPAVIAGVMGKGGDGDS